MADELKLTVGGRIYGGWEDVEISRRLETVAGGFRLSVTDRWSGQAQPWPILAGDACRLAINGETVIDGYVDQAAPSLDGGKRSLSVSGRDRTGDVVDCSAIHAAAEWHNIGLLRLAGILCEPFGVSVRTDVALSEPFGKFAVQPGETAWEALERACRLRAVLATSDGAGGVLITRTGRQRAVDDLVQGENILAGDATFDMARRYSRYIVKGQGAGTDFSFGEAVAEVSGGAADAGVPRYRPLLVMAEGAATGGVAQQRAQWEATVRAARGAAANIKVQGWTQRNGRLWLPNHLVRVTCPWLQLDGEMLIGGVTYRKSNANGTTTTLQLMRPDALTPKPEVPGGGPSSGSSTPNPWLGAFD